MRANVSRRRRRGNNGLLLTPLIDVIFLLALFFILNTSFQQERYLDVALPESESAGEIQAEGLVLTVRADGSAALDGEEVIWESLTAEIMRKAAETGAMEVILRADEELPYGKAVAALDRIRLAGLEAISLQAVKSRE